MDTDSFLANIISETMFPRHAHSTWQLNGRAPGAKRYVRQNLEGGGKKRKKKKKYQHESDAQCKYQFARSTCWLDVIFPIPLPAHEKKEKKKTSKWVDLYTYLTTSIPFSYVVVGANWSLYVQKGLYIITRPTWSRNRIMYGYRDGRRRRQWRLCRVPFCEQRTRNARCRVLYVVRSLSPF